MSALETAVRVVVDLLVRGEFETIERLTRGRQWTSHEMRRVITEYGRTLSMPGTGWWSQVAVTHVDADKRTFHVAAPLWTVEEGRSDLTLELLLQESAPETYETELVEIHVL